MENRIGEGRRLEYGSNENNGQRRMIEGGNGQENSNEEQDLILLDSVSTIGIQYSVK